MNKQEAIEKIKALKPDEQCLHEYQPEEWEAFQDGFDDGKCYVELIIEQIDEPEKPVVPKYVSDWIEWCKRNKVSLLGGFSAIDELGLAICNDKKVKSLDASGWATKNQETFTKAWFYGYEVEKEKLYTVELPNPNAGGHVVLCKTSDGIVSIAFTGMARWQGCKNFQLTEAEIKQDFEWAFRWAKEVE